MYYNTVWLKQSDLLTSHISPYDYNLLLSYKTALAKQQFQIEEDLRQILQVKQLCFYNVESTLKFPKIFHSKQGKAILQLFSPPKL